MADPSFEELINKYCFVPNRALGQNFLVSRRAVFNIAEQLDLSASDNVLEIGAGTGQLTRELANRAGHVIAVELDRGLEPLLKSYLQDFVVQDASGGKSDLENVIGQDASFCKEKENHTVEIIWSDVLKVDLRALLKMQGLDARNVKIAANLPYYATTDIMLKLFTELPESPKMVLMVQREAVSRIAARPGSKQYGPLAVLASLYGEVKTVMKLSPQMFWPQPAVGSTLLALTAGKNSLLRDTISGTGFADFLIYVFQHRRKQFWGRLRREGKFEQFPDLEDKLSDFMRQNGLNTDFRIEDLQPEQLLDLYVVTDKTDSLS